MSSLMIESTPTLLSESPPYPTLIPRRSGARNPIMATQSRASIHTPYTYEAREKDWLPTPESRDEVGLGLR